MADSRLRIILDALAGNLSGLGAARDGLKGTDADAKTASVSLKDFGGSVDDAVTKLLRTEAASKVMADAKDTVSKMSEEEKVAALAAADLADAEDKAANSAKNAGESQHGFSMALTEIQSGVSLAKEAIGGLKEVWDFAKEGAENLRVADSFQQTSRSVGVDADKMVAALDKAAHGTVDDEQLMQAATRNMALGVTTNTDQMVKLMELARIGAERFGGDAGTAFNALSEAIGNLQTRQMKQYGIIVTTKEANEKYAASHGLVVDAMTEEEQRAALLADVLEKGATVTKDFGNQNVSTAEQMKAVEVRMANIVDRAKEILAMGFSTLFTIDDAPRNIMDAFRETAAKMREEVAAGRMTTDEYNTALAGIAQNMRNNGFVMRQVDLDTEKLNADQTKQIQLYHDLTTGIRGYGGTLDESTRATQRTTEAADAQREALNAAQLAVIGYADAGDRAAQRQEALNKAMVASKIAAGVIADTTNLAIQYTDAEQKQADVQQKLDDLNAKIAAHGVAQSVVIKNQKLSTDDLTKAQLGLAVAQDNLTTAQKKKGETDAEFALRVETIKGKISDYNAKLGEHTAIVGGATKAELDQQKALEGQIAALQKSDEATKARGAFDALTAAFRAGTISQEQYTERSTALNSITHLYTDSALASATAQETLMRSFADPKSEAWRSQLIMNKDAIDGVVKSTDDATTATDNLKAAEAKPVARGETKAEAGEVPVMKGADAAKQAAQDQLDFINANKKAADEAQAAIEKVSLADERSSREMKGHIDQVAGSYTSTSNAIDTMKQHNTAMTADAIKAAQDRSAAEELASREMKGHIDSVIGEYKKIPPKIETEVITTYKDNLAEAAKGAAGDSLLERMKQVNEKKDDFVKTTGDMAAAQNIVNKAFADGMPPLMSFINNVNGIPQLANNSKANLQQLTDVGIKPTTTAVYDQVTAVSDLSIAWGKIPTTVRTTYEIVTKGTPPEGATTPTLPTIPGRASGGPTGLGGLFMLHPNEYVLSEGMRMGREQIPAEAVPTSALSGAKPQVINQYSVYLQDTLATKMWLEEQRQKGLSDLEGRM